MAQHYLLTTLGGVFLLDAEFAVRERRDFPDGKAQGYEAEWLDVERELIASLREREPGSSVIALGQRKGPAPEGAASSSDTRLRSRAAAAVLESAEFRERLHTSNIEETKTAVKASFTEDQLIIHSVRMIDDMNRAMSLLGKRFHDWLDLHQPALARRVTDDEKLVALVIEQDAAAPEGEPMGALLAEEDRIHLKELASSLKQCFEFREREGKYLEEKMAKRCPNITAIAGAKIGGKLISKAGSLQRLATLPSSTVQMLGAEQALFRHLKNPKAKPPKYGVLHEHPLIKIAKRSDHGKVARALADKLSIATRLDFFRGEYAGDRLVEELRKRFGAW